MRDNIIEEILQETLKEHLRHHARKDPVVPSASRYPHTAKRAELERGRQPRSQSSNNSLGLLAHSTRIYL